MAVPKKHFTCTVISLTLDVNCRPSHVHICIHTHTYEHTYIYTVCEKEKANHKVERLFYEHYTHMHAHTNIQRKRERKYLKYVRHPVVYSASSGLFLLLVIGTALS